VRSEPWRSSVVVRAFNEEAHIGRLLAGIERQTPKPLEVLLVDSGSTDATVPIAARWGARVVRIAPEEFSFGRALNRGIAEARGELVVMASAHVYPVWEDWLERLLQPFEDPRVSLSYGQQRGGPTTRYSERRLFARWFPDQSNPDQPQDFCNNANAAIRREVWERHRYDEALTGLEDIDWGRRARARGERLAYVAEARIVHVHDETPARVYQRYRREAIALHQIYPESHFSAWDFARLWAANVASDWASAARERALHGCLLDAPLFRALQLAGTWRGFHERRLGSQLKHRLYYPAGTRGSVAPERRAARRIEYESLPGGEGRSDD
jgi:rhamnosyltransferase